MAAPKSYPWSFRSVVALETDRAYFSAGDDTDEEDRPASLLCKWDGSSWSSRILEVYGISIAFLTQPERTVLLMGREGNVARWVAKGFTTEPVDSSDEGPQHVGDLREIRTIGKRAYVAGMGRTVYRCDGPKKWERIDQGVRVPEEKDSDAGFNSIHGFDEKSIYAGGWNGEIWSYDGKKWKKRATPTNLALFRIHCGPDGKVYAAGQAGLLLIGANDRWEVLEQEETEEDFYGSAWFRGLLHLATPNGIFVLKNGSLQKLETKAKGKAALKFRPGVSFSRLDATDQVLWSAGPKMVMYTEDGVTWTEPSYKV
jgi:hypothetical protein